ncbi:kinase-like domain-containing protein, partial [Hyaloraphidium curvatum]
MERPVSSVLVEAADIVIPDTSHILGGGGFGTVYHGTLRGEAVAVKVIRLGREHEVAQRDFLNEVKVWDRIRQRNVLPLLAYCEEPLMLVSDLVDGGDLRQALVRENWDLSLGWKYLLDVAKGMSYLHSLDIIHSDLKPGNILVDEGIAKIVDFGLSKLRDPFRSSEDDTTWGGTPGYMGPEFADPTSIGKPADVFSFAMILYEVAAQGQRPFGSALSARQVVSSLSWAIRAGTRPVRPYASEGITDATWDLITKCWAQEPSMRPTFATAKEQL